MDVEISYIFVISRYVRRVQLEASRDRREEK